VFRATMAGHVDDTIHVRQRILFYIMDSKVLIKVLFVT
ncbi:hypothetical protein THOM_0418, partial [Trachipleistophora hominis]